MDKKSKIYIAGHEGMVGSAIARKLVKNGFSNIIGKTEKEMDLKNPILVKTFFEEEKPDFVFLAAAKVGGIKANMNHQVEFLQDNLEIQINIFKNAFANNCKKLIYLGSSCIYPKETPQPMQEESLLSGKLEPTNEGYALAKITGLKLASFYCEQYAFKTLSVMPCNMYGPNDNFDLDNSHVLSALIRKFITAKENNEKKVVLWGSGIARREFMHVGDFAEALFFLLSNYDLPEFINVGTGIDISIKELAILISSKVRYKGKILWDRSMPDGMLLKRLDVSKLFALGYRPTISLEEGIEEMISEYSDLKTKGLIV